MILLVSSVGPGDDLASKLPFRLRYFEQEEIQLILLHTQVCHIKFSCVMVKGSKHSIGTLICFEDCLLLYITRLKVV